MLGVTDYGTFVGAILVFLFLPGPGNLALVSSTSKGGVIAGLAATLGVIAGDQVLMWSAVAGVAAMIQAQALSLLQWVGAAYLVWLGAHMLLARPGDGPAITILPRHYFRQAMLITLLNPKAILFYLAFFPLFVDPVHQRGMLTYAFMAGTIAALTFLYGLIATLLVHHLALRVRANSRWVRMLEKMAGACLVGFGIRLVLSR